MTSTGTNFVTLDAPAPRAPERVLEGVETRGKRVILLRPEGYMSDMRAVSNPEMGEDARLYVRICSESQWFRWAITGERPLIQDYPAYLVFVEPEYTVAE